MAGYRLKSSATMPIGQKTVEGHSPAYNRGPEGRILIDAGLTPPVFQPEVVPMHNFLSGAWFFKFEASTSYSSI